MAKTDRVVRRICSLKRLLWEVELDSISAGKSLFVGHSAWLLPFAELPSLVSEDATLFTDDT